jgi:hypothetical protein
MHGKMDTFPEMEMLDVQYDLVFHFYEPIKKTTTENFTHYDDNQHELETLLKLTAEHFSDNVEHFANAKVDEKEIMQFIENFID